MYRFPPNLVMCSTPKQVVILWLVAAWHVARTWTCEKSLVSTGTSSRWNILMRPPVAKKNRADAPLIKYTWDHLGKYGLFKEQKQIQENFVEFVPIDAQNPLQFWTDGVPTVCPCPLNFRTRGF